MTSPRISRVWRIILLTITIFSLSLPAYAKYSGGTGEPNDPYQISTAADLIALGEDPNDYDKHFILTADIDLDPNLPGRKVFDKAVVSIFTGDFDGNGHAISRLTGMGLFEQLKLGAEVRNLGLVDVNVTDAGALVRMNEGTVTQCYSTGTVSGNGVGGLVGSNRPRATVSRSYSSCTVSGESNIGGLIGTNGGIVTFCYSRSVVNGDSSVGGLVGANSVGYRGPIPFPGLVVQCYSTGVVNGTGENVGGLVGSGYPYDAVACFWDIETSCQVTSDGGIGLTTIEMQDIQTYHDAGWDLVGEIGNGTHEVWQMSKNGGYPVLAILSGYIPPELQGMGTLENPYSIFNAMELGAMIHYSPSAHYRLDASIDLSGICWGTSVIQEFAGIFDGNGHTISHLTIKGWDGWDYLGLFGQLERGAEVRNLGVMDVNIIGTSYCAGGLAGILRYGCTLANCYSTGEVSGYSNIGGLVGLNFGSITSSYSISAVIGINKVGGLVGGNDWFGGRIATSYSTGAVSGLSKIGGLVGLNDGTVTASYSANSVSGGGAAGGLVGSNGGDVTQCYSMGAVSGNSRVGGLVGSNFFGSIATSYSTGEVNGTSSVGGLVGCDGGTVTFSFWDTETSGQTTSDGGIGTTTAEMQTESTFTDAGWDFVGETANGTADIWWILEGKDYPRLWWER